jgi:hypothetical protein
MLGFPQLTTITIIVTILIETAILAPVLPNEVKLLLNSASDEDMQNLDTYLTVPTARDIAHAKVCSHIYTFHTIISWLCRTTYSRTVIQHEKSSQVRTNCNMLLNNFKHLFNFLSQVQLQITMCEMINRQFGHGYNKQNATASMW